MELFQLFWDDQKNLFLQFKKNEEEKLQILPETIKRANLRFEIYRQKACLKNPPSLICIKKFHFFKDFIVFSIELDEIFDLKGLEIKILHLTILLSCNRRIEISICRKFEMSEIYINKDFCFEFDYENSETDIEFISSLKQEKICHEHETDYRNNKEKNVYIYEKNRLKISSQNDILMSKVRENNEKLKLIEDQLREVNNTLKKMSLDNSNYVPQGPTPRGPPQRGIERIKKVYEIGPKLALRPLRDMYFLPELKVLMNDSEKFKHYLKPMSKEELNEITLDDNELKKKQMDFFNRQKEKNNLENLKVPKLSSKRKAKRKKSR